MRDGGRGKEREGEIEGERGREREGERCRERDRKGERYREETCSCFYENECW